MSQQPQHRRVGGIDLIEISVGPEAPTIMLLHGYGADCTDLVPLAAHLSVGKPINWIFPNGPQTVEIGPHVSGRAWFPISISELEKSGGANAFAEAQPPGMKRSRELIFNVLQELAVSPARLVLGGFSQGAMLATDVALRMPNGPAGLAILSGTCVNAGEWLRLAGAKKGFRQFQCHGKQDPVLGISGARELDGLFKQAGWTGRLLEFDGGHEIPLPALSQLNQYLRQTIAMLPKV